MQERFTGKIARPSAQVMYEDLPEGGLVLLNRSTQQHFRLDHVGGQMWAALVASASVDEALAALQAEFDVQPDRLLRDLSELIEQLGHHGLLDILDD